MEISIYIIADVHTSIVLAADVLLGSGGGLGDDAAQRLLLGDGLDRAGLTLTLTLTLTRSARPSSWTRAIPSSRQIDS